jgi:hypothetical protein
MDAFYEEGDRVLGHAADPYRRLDIRHASCHLVARAGDRVATRTSARSVLHSNLRKAEGLVSQHAISCDRPRKYAADQTVYGYTAATAAIGGRAAFR